MTTEDYQKRIKVLENKLSKYAKIEQSISEFRKLLITMDFAVSHKLSEDNLDQDRLSNDLQWLERITWKLLKLFSISNDHISLLDSNYKYLLVNDSYIAAHKMKRSKIIGKTVSELLGKELFNNLIKENLDKCLQGNKIHFEDWFNFSGIGKRFMDVHYIPFRDSYDNIIGVTVNSRDITERKNFENRLNILADTDSLTGLPNRRQLKKDFEFESKKAERFDRKMALYYIDLDGFKNVNDDFGHEVGDALLQEISRKLSTSLRENKYAYRVGGDEFCLLIPEFNEINQLQSLAKRVIQEIADFNNFGGMEINIGSSIGIAIYPDNGKNLQNLTSAADQAMYLVKTSTKNNFCFVNNDFCFIN
jgi:diguanylate cyclase (GGDEF)-like protein/PAS domain S-box-containing protein